MDKGIPYYGILMTKSDPWNYPKFQLPMGYSFRPYQDEDKAKWAELQVILGQLDSVEAAEKYFEDEFMQYPDDLSRKCIFVTDSTGLTVGTASIWRGMIFGNELHRVHWVAVHPQHQGKGIAKALMTKGLDIYNALGFRDLVFLTSQTWSYKAINIYLDFGFTPYMGEKPENWSGTPEQFSIDNTKAWEIIMDQINLYKSGGAYLRKVTYDKAVRDRIPDIIRGLGKECSVQQVPEAQFLELLQKKLAEEVAEYQAQPSLEELADIMEVIMAIVRLSGNTMEELEAIRIKKAMDRGGFNDRLVLKHVLEE